MQIIINLTDAQKTAMDNMLGSKVTIDAYIQNLANAHIKQQLDEAWSAKTDAEKQTLLGS